MGGGGDFLARKGLSMGNLLQPEGIKTQKHYDKDLDELMLAPHEDGSSRDKDPRKIALNKLRVHYFFNDNIHHMSSFLDNTEVEFRITDGPSWSKAIAYASAFPFTHFKGSTSQKK